MKRVLLFSMALWLTMIGMAQTGEEVVIGTPERTWRSLPTNAGYTPGRVSYTQQLFYPEEIGTIGTITSISFYKTTGWGVTRDVKIYMKLTDQQEFVIAPNHYLAFDWIEVTLDDLVYEGSFIIPEENNGWVTVILDKPLFYDGVSNLLIAFHDDTDEVGPGIVEWSVWDDSTHGLVVNNNGRTIANISNGSFQCPDPLNISYQQTIGAYVNICANYLKMTITDVNSPLVVVVPDTVDYGDAPNGAWKHPVDVGLRNEGLPGVINQVGISGSFFSIDGPELPLDLGIGQWVNYALSHGSTSEGSVNENLTVIWSDANREPISIPVIANAFSPTCPDVYELAREVTSFPYSETPTSLHNVYQLPGGNEDGLDAVYKMTFTNDVMLSSNVENGANSKVAIYAEDFNGEGGPHVENAYEGPTLPGSADPFSGWLYYDDGWYSGSSMGFDSGTYWGVAFTPEQLTQYEGCSLEKVTIYDRSSGTVTLSVYMDGENAPGQLLTTQTIGLTNSNAWRTVDLVTPILLDVTRKLWICFYTDEIRFPVTCSGYLGEDPNSCWLSSDGVIWNPVWDYGDYHCTWMIRAFVTNENGSRELRTEGEIANMTVEAGTYYLVASSTDEGFTVNINAETIPLPELAYNPTPSDCSSDLMPTMKLKWNLGQYTTAYRLLLGTTNPPQEVVVDWTDVLDTQYITGLLNNHTQYYWRVDERNSSGVTTGTVWNFTTTLPKPEDLYAEVDKLHEGDDLVLHWSVPIDRAFSNYKVYRDDALIGTTTETTFTDENLPYTPDGYHYKVTAVYDEGESSPTEPVFVQLVGYGSINGKVVEQDNITPVAGATIRLTGRDEVNYPQFYQFVTDESGCYSGEAYAGNYTVAAMKEGYQTKVYSSEVAIEFQSTTSNINFVLDEAYLTVGEVVAEDRGDVAMITWNNEPQPAEPQWLYYDNEYYVGSIGANGPAYWGISFPDMTEYAGLALTKVSYFDAPNFTGTITVNIYLGGSSSPLRLVSSQPFTVTGTGSYVDFELAVPVEIDGTESLWITCYSDDMTYPASACPNTGDAHGRWFSIDGNTWTDILMVNTSYDYTWMLRGYLEDGQGKTDKDRNRSFQYYNVYRSGCYDTIAPVLVAAELTDTVFVDTSWNDFAPGVYKWGVSKTYQGNHNQGKRELQTLLSEDFEGGVLPEGWLSYGNGWWWEVSTACANNANFTPHNGDYAAFCNSDGEGWDRYLVTTPLDLTSATSANLNFYYLLPDWGGDNDEFYVAYSESDSGPWTTLAYGGETSTWAEMNIDLTSLCGGVYYLAFIDNDYYGYCAAVDDVVVTADIIPSGYEYQTFINEDFEGGVLPEGWLSYGNGWWWEVSTACANNANFTPHNGDYAAFCNSDGEGWDRYLVTTPLDLTSATSANLNFYYLLPDWGGDNDEFYVAYSESDSGPWTTLAYGGETSTWTEMNIDLTGLCGGVYYLAFIDNDYYGYCAAVDDVVVTARIPQPDQSHESAIVWSNCLDKDMIVAVDVAVTTNLGQSPEGTSVKFFNISEPNLGYDYEVELDETGYWIWNSFHKGTYRYSINKQGYEACADWDTIMIWDDMTIECMLEEAFYPVEDLYVSPTGYALWKNHGTQADEFYYDFEDGTMGDWTLIDADGDGFNWKWGNIWGSPAINGYDSESCVYSESYDPDQGGLYPDNYLVSKRVLVGEHSVFSFHVCAQDEWWTNEHYGVAISVNGNVDPSDFVTIWEETLTGKANNAQTQSPKGSRTQGMWHYKEIDLSAYAGQEVYIALRHFNTYDVFVIDVDNIRLSNGRSSKMPMSYKVKLDGVYAGDTDLASFLHDEAQLVPNQTYTTSVAAVYATGMSDWVDYTWTYVPCDEFDGADDLVPEVEADMVQLHWTLPDIPRSNGQWYYYDNGVNLDAVGTETGASVYWAIKINLEANQANQLTKVAMFDRVDTGHEGRIMIHQGNFPNADNLLYTQEYKTSGTNDFVEFTMNEPVAIDAMVPVWIVMNNITGAYVASCSQNTGNPNGRWFSMNGSAWNDITDYGLYCTWMLRAYLEYSEGIVGTMVWRDGELLTDTPIQGNTFTDTGLAEGDHEYCIRVVHDGMPDSTYYAMSCALCEEVLVTSVNEDEQQLVQVYPNPTRDGIIVKATDMRRLRIVNSLGQLVYDREVNGDEFPVAMGAYGSGVYVIQVITTHGVSERRVIVTD